MQHEKSATWKKWNTEKVQHGKSTTRKSATWKKCNTENVEHAKSATWKKYNMKIAGRSQNPTNI